MQESSRYLVVMTPISKLVVYLLVVHAAMLRAAPVIHEVAADGAWTWFNDERAVWQDGRIQVGYVRSDG